MNDKNVAHFDVDNFLESRLTSGEIFPFCLSIENLHKISNKDKIEIITIKSSSKIDKKLLNQFPNLKLIITRTVGTDHIDLKACQEKKIKIMSLPDYGSEVIAEHAMALLLAGCRQIIKANKAIHLGKFSYCDFLGISLSGKTLGVIGVGKIGLAFIKMAKGFNLKILAFDVVKNIKATKDLGFSYVSFDELIKQSDIISLHLPLSSETHYLINKNVIDKMKDNVILINTARGGVIDTQALVNSIKKFRFIGLDVLEDEKNFGKFNPLLKFDNILITPHLAFYTDESLKNIASQTLNIINKV